MVQVGALERVDPTLTKNTFHAATSGSGDFDSLSTPVIFPIGSAEGAEKCVSIAVNPDDLVESEEEFSIILSLSSTGDSLNLGTHASTVTLFDSDGMWQN
jgi:hypothetical protein